MRSFRDTATLHTLVRRSASNNYLQIDEGICFPFAHALPRARARKPIVADMQAWVLRSHTSKRGDR